MIGLKSELVEHTAVLRCMLPCLLYDLTVHIAVCQAELHLEMPKLSLGLACVAPIASESTSVSRVSLKNFLQPKGDIFEHKNPLKIWTHIC